MLKTMNIEIMHANFQIDGTNILGVLQKISGSLFFFDHPVVLIHLLYYVINV